MLDALFKPRFYKKCKVAIKITKARLDAINKKRSAMLKFLNNDIADLLRNGLDYNAYTRVEGLIIEQNMTSCYNLIHHFCQCILTHLSTMLNHRECPEECREAVSSLAFAAARFSDLPELRDLRTLFSHKYGTSIVDNSFVNKEFASRLRPQPPSKEMKLELMRDIALDISLEWDSKALEQKLFTPQPPPLTNPTTKKEEKDTKEPPPPTKKCSNSNTRRESLPNSVNEFGAQRRPQGNHKFQSSSSSPKAAAATTRDNKDEAVVDDAPLPEEKGVDNKKLHSSSSSSYRNIPPPYLITAKPEKEQVPTAKAEQQLKPRSVRQIRRQFPQPPSSDTQHEEEDKKKKLGNESLLFGAPPSRVLSLPPEEAAVWRQPKPNHNILRPTTSLQQHGGHVHPNLPDDFDDLTTRMASLKKKMRNTNK